MFTMVMIGFVGLVFALSSFLRDFYGRIASIEEERLKALNLASSITGYWRKHGDGIDLVINAHLSQTVLITSIVARIPAGLILFDRHNTPSPSLTINGIHTPLPYPLRGGDNVTIHIAAVGEVEAVSLTLSASPIVVVVPLKKEEAGGGGGGGGGAYPRETVVLLPERLGGYVVAEKAERTLVSPPLTLYPTSLHIDEGSLVAGDENSLNHQDSDMLIVNPERKALCPGYDGWRYVRLVNITNPNPYEYHNIQVRIRLGASFNYEHARRDGYDLRVLSTNCTPLDYWIEEWDPDAKRATIWVKVPYIAPRGSTTVLLVYGNPSADRGEHEGLARIIESLPARDGPGYRIHYEETLLKRRGLVGGGRRMNWHADDGAWSLNLPFSFPFYNRRLTRIYVCSNGFISERRITDWSDSVRELRSRLMIAPFWEDLMTRGRHDIYVNTTYSDEVGRGVVVRWDTNFYWGYGRANFELILYDNGVIRFDYGSIDGRGGDRPTIGVSLGDRRHYTVASYNNRQADQLSYAYSLVFWPRKKPAKELYVEVGEEREFVKYVARVSVDYSVEATSLIHSAEIATQQPDGIQYSYTLEVYRGESRILRRTLSTTSRIQGSITINRVASGLVTLRLEFASPTPYQLQLDKLVLKAGVITSTSPALYIASNKTDNIIVYDPSTGNTATITLDPTMPSQGYTLIAVEEEKLWVARGTTIACYNTITGTWETIGSLPEPPGPGGFIALNNTHIYYYPGPPSSQVIVLNKTSLRQQATIQLPQPLDEWAATAKADTTTYIYTGETGKLLLLDTLNGEVSTITEAPFSKITGMDYDPATDRLWFILANGGIYYLDLATMKWHRPSLETRYITTTPGDRLAYIPPNLYHVRGEDTAELTILNTEQ